MATKSSQASAAPTLVTASEAPSKDVKESKEVKEKVTVDSLASMPGLDLAQSAHYHVLQVSDTVQNRLGRLLREHGLTLSQYQILRVLVEVGTPLPSLVVAQAMFQPAPGITGLVTRLEEQGMVRRKQDKQDKRVTQVELTPKARVLLKKLEKPVLNLHRGLATGLNDAELKQLAKLLDKAWRGMQTASKPE